MASISNFAGNEVHQCFPIPVRDQPYVPGVGIRYDLALRFHFKKLLSATLEVDPVDYDREIQPVGKRDSGFFVTARGFGV